MHSKHAGDLMSNVSRLKERAEYLDLTDFCDRYFDCEKVVKSRSFKLERTQVFDEPKNPSYVAYSDGNHDLAWELLHDCMDDYHAAFETFAFQNSISSMRVRAVEFPLSDYLKWELKAYEYIAWYGQSVAIFDLTKVPRDDPRWRSIDFNLFDKSDLFVQDYSTEGVLLGGWHSTNSSILDDYAKVAELFVETSIPLGVFLHQQKHKLAR